MAYSRGLASSGRPDHWVSHEEWIEPTGRCGRPGSRSTAAPSRRGRRDTGVTAMATHALIDDMGVDDVGFLIENLGADASELQYLRELVQNGFESIQRARRRDGQVLIDFEEVKGVRKLRITDN